MARFGRYCAVGSGYSCHAALLFKRLGGPGLLQFPSPFFPGEARIPAAGIAIPPRQVQGVRVGSNLAARWPEPMSRCADSRRKRTAIPTSSRFHKHTRPPMTFAGGIHLKTSLDGSYQLRASCCSYQQLLTQT